jgi:hypothetical protein
VQELRAQLFAMLGGRCEECDETVNLEIDHPWGRDWVPRKVASYNRNLRYLREAREGKVRLLCHDCNMTIRPVRAKPALTGAGEPF